MGVSAVLRGAHAQSGDASDIATQLYKEGYALAKAHRCAEAVPKFEESLQHDPKLTTQLNLALCYEELDKLASASRLYRDLIANEPKDAQDAQARERAQGHEAAIAPRLGTLTLFPPDNPPAGFVVTRNGVPIEPSELGSTQPIDAGTYQIIASAPGFEPYGRTVTVVDGHVATVPIPLLTAKPVPAVVTDVPKPAPRRHTKPPEPTAPPSRTRTYVAIGAGAAGVAAVGIGLVFGANARSDNRDAKGLCGPKLICNNIDDLKQGKKQLDDAYSNATTATVLVAAGGAAVIAGAIVFLTAPSAREHNRAQVVPVAHDRGAGLAVVGSF